MKKKTLILALTLIISGVFALTAPSIAHAQSNINVNINGVPGWGFGDKHHIHIGPPGLSVRPKPVDPDELRRAIQQFVQELLDRVFRRIGRR